MEDFDDSLEEALLEDFDDQTAEKGRAYFVRGAVREIVESGEVLTALVKGSRPHPYVVTIPIGPEDGLPDAVAGDCTCPMSAMCKHVAATIMAYVRGVRVPSAAPRTGTERVVPFVPRQPPLAGGASMEERQRSFVLQQLDRSLGTSTRPLEAVVPLEGATAAPFSPWVAEHLRPRPPRTPSNERWRLAFAVGIARAPSPGSAASEGNTAQRPMIFPAAQYVKKNGEPGRVDRYRPDRLIEPPDPASAGLLFSVQAAGNRSALLLHWDYVVAHPTIRLFASDGDGRTLSSEPYALRKILSLTIRMEPVLERHGERIEVALEPVFVFEMEGGPVPDTPPLAWAEAWQGRLIVSLGASVLAWMDGDPRYVGLARDLMFQRPHLSVAESHSLQRACAADAPAGVRIEVPYRAVRVVSSPPDVCLVVAEARWSEGIVVTVRFDYGQDRRVEDGVCLLRTRDPGRERGIARSLAELFGASVPMRPAWLGTEEESATPILLKTTIDQFLLAHGETLLTRGVDLCLHDPSQRVERASGPVRVFVESGIDWFGLKAEAGEPIDLKSIDPRDELFASGLVRAGGKLLYIGKQEAEKLKALLELLDPDAKDARVPARDLDALRRLGEIAEKRPPDLDRLVAVARALGGRTQLPEIPVPAGLTATLRSYQKAGYSWLSYLADNGLNGCLADDMGLGKTVQALAMLLRNKEAGTAGPSLVVAPVSTLRNWLREAERFAPGLDVVVHHGLGRTRDAAELARADLVVVSYATLRVDDGLFQSLEYDTVVLDEAQSIKNPTSQSFAVVKGLRARHRFTLTGTPLENSVVDLWSQLDFLEPGLLGSLSRFRKAYGSASKGPRVDRLRRMIRPFILRRTKDVVEASLPPKEETTLYAEMGARQAAAYQTLRKRYRLLVSGALKSKGIARSGALIFEGMLRLRQAASFPAQADAAYAGVPSCKLEVLTELMDEVLAEGHRVLVFSQFVQSLAEIRQSLDGRKISYEYLDGSTRKRQEVIDRFQSAMPSGGAPQVFLLSLKAGGVGINLTAADYVVLFDPWWNPAVESQAVDRTHRIGQTKHVFVYRIVTRDSIEEQILSLQERKRALARDLIDQDRASLLSLSEGEILGLFGEE